MTSGLIFVAMTVTIAFSSHRPETLPLAERLMGTHTRIVIEEPPTPEFSEMLNGGRSVDDFLETAEYEYPAFARASCRMLRRLHQDGKCIHPCEPFMGDLIRIHDHFAAGGRPAALKMDGRLGPVYQAERKATGRLLAFYKAAASDDFDRMVTAACDFAAADAARFALRDRLRAQAMARLMAGRKGKVYVEAGYLHLRLLRELRRALPRGPAIKPVFLLREVYRAAGQGSHLYNPGDLLTLALIFDRVPALAHQRLLAARSLIYNRLVVKEEVIHGEDAYPDAREDMAVIGLVNQLGFDDCRRLYARVAGMAPGAARQAASAYRAMDV